MIEVPAVPHHADDENRERDEDGDQHQTVADVERLFLTVGLPQWGGSSRSRISDRPRDPERQRQREKDQPEPRRREQREPREFLRDSHLKRVDRAERRAHTGGTHTYRCRNDVVEPQSRREKEQHRHERNDFFVHVVQCTTGSERQTNDRNHQQLAIAQPLHHPSDTSS